MSTHLTDPLGALTGQGVSVWLDDLSRGRLLSGELAGMIERDHLRGVTTNPTIFASAVANGSDYDAQTAALAEAGASADEAVMTITTDDVRSACDVFAGVHEATAGKDGRVSIEVDPRLAQDTAGTVEAARLLWATVDRPNLMVKIPATAEGLPAITQAIGEGISVNVTLIFSLDRYRAVAAHYLDGLERAQAAGLDLSAIRSVASFFVSRMDTAVDARLAMLGTEAARSMRGKAGVANARLAYQTFERIFSSPRWRALEAAGAHRQRPLWASTGVKDPAYRDTMYVEELVARDVVSTMPEATLRAVADHGAVQGDTIRGTYDESREVLDSLERLGISYHDVTEQLETEGVEKFVTSWEELLTTVRAALGEREEAR